MAHTSLANQGARPCSARVEAGRFAGARSLGGHRRTGIFHLAPDRHKPDHGPHSFVVVQMQQGDHKRHLTGVHPVSIRPHDPLPARGRNDTWRRTFRDNGSRHHKNRIYGSNRLIRHSRHPPSPCDTRLDLRLGPGRPGPVFPDAPAHATDIKPSFLT